MSEIEGIRSAARVPPAPVATVPGASAGVSGSTSGSTLPPIGAGQPGSAKPQPVERQQIEESVAKIADYVQTIQRNLSFKLDDTTGQTVITVTDSQTEEVIRQIPSEYILELAQNLKELQEALSNTKGNLLEVRV
ncbi:MAG: flagellar protein FlaG [Gammaproteobacteria bacterium]|nr:flagellar protein FlaG [Gammaproteobacteria bacterium]NND39058.1 flagellar protein FlaG [Pseudomonadales bacterium]MBT8150309.1 flagellar protein FlaG [Gammaproteobacteria bacterium]NNL10957.1 flagellar protein FlaG [Pseudomonadales bacterium]NNM11905.1 flagellar protein FlaG [Pseudomonadales bacterium]